MCICINCYYYKLCNLKIKIEDLNKNLKLKQNNFFYRKFITPKFTRIKLNFFKTKLVNEIEFDLIECNLFLEFPKNWLISKNQLFKNKKIKNKL